MGQIVSDLVAGHGDAFADNTIHPGILDQLDPVPVYSHVGTLPKGGKVTLNLYRITGLGTARLPE